ncbi:MAG: DUF4331 family protein [Verrucomicrobiota bacterium]
MSDHASGPRAMTDPVVDITDMYAFTSPTRPGFPWPVSSLPVAHA